MLCAAESVVEGEVVCCALLSRFLCSKNVVSGSRTVPYICIPRKEDRVQAPTLMQEFGHMPGKEEQHETSRDHPSSQIHGASKFFM